MRVLAADIGGTKTVVALCDVDGDRVRTLDARRYESRAHASVESILEAFTREVSVAGISAACLGVAGPVEDGRCRATNLPWVIEAERVRGALGAPIVRVVNDFHAAAAGIEALGDDQRVTVQPGSPRAHAPRVVIGAGTGLGEALVVWGGAGWVCVPGEGGHADFGARTAREARLAEALRARYGRVSWERVVSGMGIADIYAHLRDDAGLAESPAVAAELRAGDAGAVVGAHALAGDDPLCVEALDLFLEAYGAEAGNAALRVIARGGVFLAGGIAAKVLPRLLEGAFLRGFLDKGRMRDIAASVPVYVVTEENLGLLGAALLAR